MIMTINLINSNEGKISEKRVKAQIGQIDNKWCMVDTYQLEESWTGFTPPKEKKKNFSSRSIGRKKEIFYKEKCINLIRKQNNFIFLNIYIYSSYF